MLGSRGGGSGSATLPITVLMFEYVRVQGIKINSACHIILGSRPRIGWVEYMWWDRDIVGHNGS